MLHKFHRMSALLIGLFVVFHLINHLCILGGVQLHIDFMESFRLIYRNVIVECLLLACVLFQVCSGVYFVWQRRGKRSGFLEKAQVISGVYLAYFFVIHVGAVLFGRFGAELDTNIYYGIAGFHTPPFQFYFIPYYFLAVVAIFVHLASAFNWLSRDVIANELRTKIVYLIIAIGISMSTILTLGFSGVFHEIVIPQEYGETYG